MSVRNSDSKRVITLNRREEANIFITSFLDYLKQDLIDDEKDAYGHYSYAKEEEIIAVGRTRSLLGLSRGLKFTYTGREKEYFTTWKNNKKISRREIMRGRKIGIQIKEKEKTTVPRPRAPIVYPRRNDHDVAPEVDNEGRRLMGIGEVKSLFDESLKKAIVQMINDRNSSKDAGSKVGKESVLAPEDSPTLHEGIPLSDESFSTLASLLSRYDMTYEQVVTIMYNIKAGRFHDKNGADPSQRSRSSIYDFELENSNNGWGMKTINEDWWNVPGDGIGDD